MSDDGGAEMVSSSRLRRPQLYEVGQRNTVKESEPIPIRQSVVVVDKSNKVEPVIITENIEETESVENGAGLANERLNPSLKSHSHKKQKSISEDFNLRLLNGGS